MLELRAILEILRPVVDRKMIGWIWDATVRIILVVMPISSGSLRDQETASTMRGFILDMTEMPT